MAVLKSDFLPSDLKKELNKVSIAGSVAVQARQSEIETDFLIGLAASNEIIKAIVGWVDLRAENIEERLSHYASLSNKIKGFRHVVQAESEDFMQGKAFENGIGHLARFGFTYDILIFPNQLKSALELVRKFPNQQFVIDHMAKPYIAKGMIDHWAYDIHELAQADNVYCKMSGMVTEAHWTDWRHQDLVPYMEEILEAFGTKRVMYGSDWPVCLLGGRYQEILRIVTQFISNLESAPTRSGPGT